MMKTKTKIGLALLLILLLGLLAAIYQFNRKVPGLDSTPAAFSLSADQLFNDFDSDETTANAKYLDQVIEVSGTIQSVKTENGTTIVSLTAENAMMGGINCSFNEEIPGLVEGDMVRIKGRCQGFLMEVILNNCVIHD